jgi:hypothetical protein
MATKWEGRQDNKAPTLAAWLNKLKGYGCKITTIAKTQDVWLGRVVWSAETEPGPDGVLVPRPVTQEVMAARLANGQWARVAKKNLA